jgi:hypothetical protein
MKSVIVKDAIKKGELTNCLQVFFEDWGVSVSPYDLNESTQKADILFECLLLHGDFRFELCLYTIIEFSIEDLSMSICKRFGTEVLISDDNLNPYLWILITAAGKFGPVKQVVRDDEYFIIQRP